MQNGFIPVPSATLIIYPVEFGWVPLAQLVEHKTFVLCVCRILRYLAICYSPVLLSNRNSSSEYSNLLCDFPDPSLHETLSLIHLVGPLMELTLGLGI